MVTEKLTITNGAWTAISISGTSVMLQGEEGDILLAVGASAPTADDHAFKIGRVIIIEGFSLDGLSSSDNVYVKSVTNASQTLVAMH